jgi:Arc/MetJ-type ribon-helix-helix transcriptional regulator
MNAITVLVPSELQSQVEARLAGGEYVDEGDYLRDLIRRDLDMVYRRDELRALIAEGFTSGVCEDDARTVLQQIIDEDPDLRV